MQIIWTIDINHANAVLRILGDVTGMSWSQIDPIIAPLRKQLEEQLKAEQNPVPDNVVPLNAAPP